MSDERREPFVGKVSSYGILRGSVEVVVLTDEVFVPATTVVVTPLLPDDPRPGETWITKRGNVPVVIVTAPFLDVNRKPTVIVETKAYSNGLRFVSDLRRPSVLKTFRLRHSFGGVTSIQAESKEAAITKLSEALEEVSDG